ncbi:MAG: Hint domain-containing protein [Paracoccaceae bacterium]
MTTDQIHDCTASALPELGPGFGPGVHLQTDRGPVPVDWLAAGDRVLTLDHGYQPILWVGRSRVSTAELASNPALRPIVVPAGRFGRDGPDQDLLLSPDHRVLVASALVEHHVGTPEALAACKFLSDAGHSAPQSPAQPEGLSYYQVLFSDHELVLAEGLWVESFFTSDAALEALDATARQQAEAALGGSAGAQAMLAARYVLTDWECKAMRLATLPAATQAAKGARYGSKSA